MGLFSEIKWNYWMPPFLSHMERKTFQTKNLPNQDGTYTVNYWGELEEKMYQYADKSRLAEERKKNPDFKLPEDLPAVDKIKWHKGKFSPVYIGKRKVNFTGKVRMYSTLDPGQPKSWIEFNVVFVKGKVRDVECTEHLDADGKSLPKPTFNLSRGRNIRNFSILLLSLAAILALYYLLK